MVSSRFAIVKGTTAADLWQAVPAFGPGPPIACFGCAAVAGCASRGPTTVAGWGGSLGALPSTGFGCTTLAGCGARGAATFAGCGGSAGFGCATGREGRGSATFAGCGGRLGGAKGVRL